MKRYKQRTTKISCKDDKEFVDKVNKLNMAGDMCISIKTTTPEKTDNNQWYAINYWTYE